MRDTARLNLTSTSFEVAKQQPHKSIKLKGVEIDHKVLLFLLEHEDIFNVFGELIDFIDKIKPIPDSEIKVEYDEDMDNLTYEIEIPNSVSFEERMKISDTFFDFVWDNFPKEIRIKNTLQVI